MVNVTDDAVMAEPISAITSTTTAPSVPSFITNSPHTVNSSIHARKPRGHGHSHHHLISPQFHTHYHHCTFSAPTDATADANGSGAANTNGAAPPAKFYFGPGFEPQQQIPGVTGFGASSSQGQGGEYVVLFHVHPGVTINLQIGETLEILRGPVTVPMVSTNSSPPIAMPVQVPPGHVVQQIVDESGTLRHVILQPQHPPGLVPLTSHTQHYGANPSNGTNQPQPFFPAMTGFPPQHYHSNRQPSGLTVTNPPHLGNSPPPNANFFKDERTQRQHTKLKKKLQEKQQKPDIGLPPRKDLVNGLKRSPGSGVHKDKGMNSVGTSEDGEESSVPDEDDTITQLVTDILSSVQAPKVSEISSRSALLKWDLPSKTSETVSNDGHSVDIVETDLRYEVLLSDKSKEMKFKSIYSGPALSCRIQDLKPGQEYSVCLQVHLDELQGNPTDPTKFTTPPCEPEKPQPPKLMHCTKNFLQLRLQTVNNNGAPFKQYILLYEDCRTGEIQKITTHGKLLKIPQLQPDTEYSVRLFAENSVGRSPSSDMVKFRTLDNPPSQPPPPELSEAFEDKLRLQWLPLPKDTDYTLEMNDPSNKYGFQAVYYGKEVSYTKTNLHYYSDYTFRLSMKNDSGKSPYSEEVTYRTLPSRPGKPSKPVVVDRIRAYHFKLKWDAPSTSGGAEITKYTLEINSGSGYEEVYSGKAMEAVCDRLTPGTTYQLRVKCCSSGGSSNYSDTCTVTTEAICPGICSTPKLNGKPKSNSIGIKWIGPDYSGGAPVLEYEVEMQGPEATSLYRSKETEYIVDEGIHPGCDYTFMVRALNRIGSSEWSEPLTVTSGATPPDCPTIPRVTCKSPTMATIEWSEPASNGAPIIEYRLDMSSETDDEENFTNIYQGLQTNYLVKVLPFTKYYIRVQACNSAGCSGYSPVVATLTPSAAPSAVVWQKHSCKPQSITLHWTPPAHNGAPITHYNIEIGDRKISTEGSVTEYTIDRLQPETQYKIKIQAVNDVAPGAFSNTLRAITAKLPPAAPRLECVTIAHNYLKLKWGDGKNTDYTQYCLEIENSHTHDFQCIYRGTAFAYKVNKLHETTTYKFRINATNDAGTGEYSKEYEYTTKISPPAVLKQPKIVEIEQRSCSLEWTPVRNSFSDPIVYEVQVAKLKEQSFSQTYKGPELKCSVDNLDPGMEYCARVCPIRFTNSGELPGPFSQITNFMTLPSEPSSTTKLCTVNNSPSHTHKNRSLYHSLLHQFRSRTFTDKHYKLLISFLFAIVGIMLAVFIMWLL